MQDAGRGTIERKRRAGEGAGDRQAEEVSRSFVNRA